MATRIPKPGPLRHSGPASLASSARRIGQQPIGGYRAFGARVSGFETSCMLEFPHCRQRIIKRPSRTTTLKGVSSIGHNMRSPFVYRSWRRTLSDSAHGQSNPVRSVSMTRSCTFAHATVQETASLRRTIFPSPWQVSKLRWQPDVSVVRPSKSPKTEANPDDF